MSWTGNLDTLFAKLQNWEKKWIESEQKKQNVFWRDRASETGFKMWEANSDTGHWLTASVHRQQYRHENTYTAFKYLRLKGLFLVWNPVKIVL